MEKIRVAVVGADGRMGGTVCNAVKAADDMELVAEITINDELTTSTLNGAEVAVEFTVPSATQSNVKKLIDLGCHVVVGTTGWTQTAYDDIAAKISEDAAPHVLIAPNFALGAVLMMKFAAMAAPYFESVEVIEMHHPNKVDAPSGTAIATAQKIAAARRDAGCQPLPDATETDPNGARGSLYDGVPVHAVRLRGLNAHEEILLGNPGEQFVLRSDCFDRGSFMPGVLHAVRKVGALPGLTIGLEKILD
ncbi:MAG: 4-hydroxy-tetrahydrodipicolinate reductase [Actinomycetaceae bacterium]|nr:4-hydroxy-tetrahydrodipicolinate reductase [Actinomycetaceae bacterium]